jgi:Planctomycete cytochrome C
MFFAPPPPPPASYSQDVAPVLAMRCNVCHGDAGGLSTRSFSGLMAGGNLGKVVIAGDADRSLLLHFIDGRRGTAHRMPLGGRALSAREIDVFRRWIDEGARQDSVMMPRYAQTRRTELPPGRMLRVTCRLKTSAYLTLTIVDSQSGQTLLERLATVKSPREDSDAGEPGDPIFWDVRAEPGWPAAIEVRLTAEYAPADPGDMEFGLRLMEE